MNKKFLSAILFGALMVTSTGTFVSCKDYDDDIENLQTQIDKLATKDELTSQIASLQSALSTAQASAAAAQTDATKALAAASEAEKAAAKAALDAANAKVEALAAAEAEVAKAKAELEKAIDADFEALQAELSATVNGLTKKVEELTGLSTAMITSIDLQAGYDAELNASFTNSYLYFYYNLMPEYWLDEDDKEVDTFVFGEGFTGELTLKANELFSNPNSSKLMISVSPANAVITADMLSIVNSKGEDLSDLVDLTVEKYEGLLTRSVKDNGLYVVTPTLKKTADLETLEEGGLYVEDKEYNRPIRFALAATKDGRTVTSQYDLSVSFNRWKEGLCGLYWNSTIESSAAEKANLGEYQNYGTTGDNEWCYPVVAGEAFQIAVNPECGRVLASYVTVDMENENLTTTDKAAINGLKFAGVNTVTEGIHNITINGAKGVVVPLKVTALGFDGYTREAVVWVKAGYSSEITQTAAYVITPEEFVAEPTNYPYEGVVPFKVPTGYSRYQLSITDEEDGINFKGDLLTFFEDAKCEKPTTDPAKIAYAKFAATVNLQQLKDNKVYTGTVKFYNNESTFLGQSAISIQKVLPTAFPADFQPKVNQLDTLGTGTLNAFMLPMEGGKIGKKDLKQSFNGLEDVNYIITIAGAGDKDENDVREDLVITSAYEFDVDEELIDNETKHAVTVEYQYGYISSEVDKDNNPINVTVKGGEWKNIIFSCLAEINTYAWVKAPSLTYDQKDAETALANIKVTNSRDGKYTTTLDKLLTALEGDDYPMIDMTEAEMHLYSQTAKGAGYVENSKDEYFSVALGTINVGTEKEPKDGQGLIFTPNSEAQNPEATVYSTLVIKAKDYFGHDVNIVIKDLEVKKR